MLRLRIPLLDLLGSSEIVVGRWRQRSATDANLLLEKLSVVRDITVVGAPGRGLR